MKNGHPLAFDRKAEAIYRTKLKPKLEKKYKGRIVAIDVDSGDYFLGRTVSFSCLAMRALTTVFAGILIASPVAGFRPIRALRF